ncbi:hypothetical protein [Hymenobacter sediminis]|nr:hypothetical protein [Hymenobacter sediminis]
MLQSKLPSTWSICCCTSPLPATESTAAGAPDASDLGPPSQKPR